MEFVQKKGSTRHTFTLHSDKFNFAYQDKSGAADADMSYADLPLKTSIQIEQNEWLRNVGYLWMAIGVFQIGYAIHDGGSLSGKGFWLLLGIGCVLWAHFSKIQYTVLRGERGNVFIMQDKSHDRILDELMGRRKAQLAQWYGDVNPQNDLDHERAKFQWLVEQDVITAAEAEQKIAQAALLKEDHPMEPEKSLN